MLVYLLIGLVIAAVAYWLWRQHQERLHIEQEREVRRARTDELLARVLLGERPGEGRKTAAGGKPSLAKPVPPTIERMAKPVGDAQRIDIDMLLGDESDAVAARARRQLERPTSIALDAGDAGAPRTTTVASASPLSLQDGGLDVPLDQLVLAWFEARGYTTRPAPDTAAPVRALLTHGADRDRSYAFVYERGRLNAQRATRLLEQARALGMNKLLVAAEHGTDPAVASARLRDVHTMDWVAIDREMKKIDFRVAAKIIAIARERGARPRTLR